MPENTPQPAVDAAKEYYLTPLCISESGESILSSIIARHYAPLTERVKELEGALAKERAIMSHVLEGGGEELTLPEAVIACELRSKQAESKLIALRTRVAELNSKYASAEADGNSLREERERLITRVAELEKDRERLITALEFIAENAGHTIETECGLLKCNSSWATEQCRAAIASARAKESRQPTPCQPAPQDKPEVAP